MQIRIVQGTPGTPMAPRPGYDHFLRWHTTAAVRAQSRRPSRRHDVALDLAHRQRRRRDGPDVLLRRVALLLDARGRGRSLRFGACFRARAGQRYVRVQVHVKARVVHRPAIGRRRHLARDHRRRRRRGQRRRRRCRRVARGRSGLRAGFPWRRAGRRGCGGGEGFRLWRCRKAGGYAPGFAWRRGDEGVRVEWRGWIGVAEADGGRTRGTLGVHKSV